MTSCLPIVLILGAFSASDEAAEPPLLFDVKIGDKTVSFAEGEQGQLSGTFKKAPVELTIRPYREFKNAGIYFRYPREYVFQAEVADWSFKSWTVKGSDTSIVFSSIFGGITKDEYIHGVLPDFGEGNAQVLDRNAELSLGDSTLTGLTVRIDVDGGENENILLQQVFFVPLTRPRSGLLILQATPNESGEHSDEFLRTKKLLSESFRFE